jgi:hypothetical protein
MTVRARTTQWKQVVSALDELGGVATLSQLSRHLLAPGGDATKWATKTPEATIRRIVRNTPEQIHVLKPGLYCLQDRATTLEKDYALPQEGDVPPGVEDRNHWYYQGLLLEIGNSRKYKTYVPSQDGNRSFGSQKLRDVCAITSLPSFGYSEFMRRARTVDVIWFNRREMPAAMFEVELSTDMLNSLAKFNELRDFYTQLRIVAPAHRKPHFEDRIGMDTLHEIRSRVKFVSIGELEDKYTRGRL